MRISEIDYFGKPHSPEQRANAIDLLQRVDALTEEAIAAGAFEPAVNPNTGCEISGAPGGDGDGGLRTPASQTGAVHSRHRQAMAVDVYDPGDRLDTWLDGFETANGGNSMLEKHALWREDPSKTSSWCHLQSAAPLSGRRTFMP
jgi:hypothetical protein